MRNLSIFRRPRWQLTLGIVFLAQLMTAVGFSMVFPFLPLYVSSLDTTLGLSVELSAGLVISVQGFTMMVASPIWGVFADRYGRKLMVMRAMFGGTVLLLLMAFARTAEQLILLRGLQGLVTGTVAANNALVASQAPRERVGFAMGALQVGLWGGIAAGPLLGGVLADAYGYAMPFFITSALLLLAGLLVYFGVEEDFVPASGEQDGAGQMSFLEQWRHVLAAQGVTLVYFIRFMAGVGRMLLIPIAPLFVVSLLPADAAAQSVYAGMVIAVQSATSTLSGVYLGQLGDRIGHRKILMGSAVVAAIFYVPQIFVTAVWQLLALQAVTGLATGGLIAAPSALLARYTQLGEEGAVYGIDNSIVSASRAVAPLVGAGVALVFGLRGTFAAAAVLFVCVAYVSFRYLPDGHRKRKPMSVAAAGD